MSAVRTVKDFEHLRTWDRRSLGAGQLSRLVGLPVIDLSRAHRLGHVQDVFIDPNVGRLTSVQVDQKRVAGSQVRRLGGAAIVVFASQLFDEDGLPEEAQGGIATGTIFGMEVLSDWGDLVGHLSDVHLEPESLEVVAFELRTPAIERWLRGGRLILPERMLICSAELMIVSRFRTPPPGAEAADDRWEGDTLKVVVRQPTANTRAEEPRHARSA